MELLQGARLHTTAEAAAVILEVNAGADAVVLEVVAQEHHSATGVVSHNGRRALVFPLFVQKRKRGNPLGVNQTAEHKGLTNNFLIFQSFTMNLTIYVRGGYTPLVRRTLLIRLFFFLLYFCSSPFRRCALRVCVCVCVFVLVGGWVNPYLSGHACLCIHLYVLSYVA